MNGCFCSLQEAAVANMKVLDRQHLLNHALKTPLLLPSPSQATLLPAPSKAPLLLPGPGQTTASQASLPSPDPLTPPLNRHQAAPTDPPTPKPRGRPKKALSKPLPQQGTAETTPESSDETSALAIQSDQGEAASQLRGVVIGTLPKPQGAAKEQKQEVAALAIKSAAKRSAALAVGGCSHLCDLLDLGCQLPPERFWEKGGGGNNSNGSKGKAGNRTALNRR